MANAAEYDLVIVGGGAAGLFAAISAARAGIRVCVLEQKERTGKKILMTGNGRCNLTNRTVSPDSYPAPMREFVAPALDALTEEEALAQFKRMGLPVHFRGDYAYPRSDQAAAVAEALQETAKHLGVMFLLNAKVTGIRRQIPHRDMGRLSKSGVRPDSSSGGFVLEVLEMPSASSDERSARADRVKSRDKSRAQGRADRFSCRAVLLACGSKAAPRSGSDGSGYVLARALGLTVGPVLPALTPLICHEPLTKVWAGVRTACRVSVHIGDAKGRQGHKNQENAKEKGGVLYSDTGEIQLTDYGISGIPVFQVSRYAVRALSNGKSVMAELDFLPEYPRSELQTWFDGQMQENDFKTVEPFLQGLLPKKLIRVLARKLDISEQEPVGKLGRTRLWRILELAKEFVVPVTNYRGFEQAQVCQGGLSLREFDAHTLMARQIPGLFAAGEILDVDGPCGGFNLHWAWASGHLAGLSAAGFCQDSNRLVGSGQPKIKIRRTGQETGLRVRPAGNSKKGGIF